MRYAVREYGEYHGQKTYGVWDETRQEFIRDHCNLVSFSPLKSLMESLARLLNEAGKIGKVETIEI